MRANWQTTRKWKWTKLAFIDRRRQRRRRRWRWRRNCQVWRRFVWMETVSKLPYSPTSYRSPPSTQSHLPPPHTGIRFNILLLLSPTPAWAVALRFVINQLMISNVANLLTILWWPTGNGMCVGGGGRRGQWAAAVSPGHNQNLCLDRRLTIAICHKLPERAHNLRMTTQPNKCPAHFSITAKCALEKNVQTMHVPIPVPLPIPIPDAALPIPIAGLRSSLHFNFLFDK